MDSPTNSQEMVSCVSDEDVEFASELEPQPYCSCGAYDKIVCATNLLRRRLVNAVMDELDQYEQPLSSLLRLSKQGHSYKGSDVTVGADQSQLSSQSHTQNSQVVRSACSDSLDLLINKIVVNASLLLLSKIE